MVSWNLADLFESVADVVPEREAMVTCTRRLSYRQLDRRANRLAHLLAGNGVGPGDRVGLSLRNGNLYIEAMLAAFKLRAVPFNVDHRYTAEEVAYLLDDADPKVVLHAEDLASVIEPAVAAPGAPAVVVLTGQGDDHEARLRSRPDVRPDPTGRTGDDHYLLFTGGTTGMPKGVVWRHRDVYFAALGGADMGIPAVARPEDVAARAVAGRARCLPASPFIHGTAQWVAWATLLEGGTVITDPSPTFDAERLWDLAVAEAATSLVIVGDAFARPLADALEAEPDRWELSTLLVVLSGGAGLSPTIRRTLLAHLPWAAVVDGYGTSETGGQGRSVAWAGADAGDRPRFAVGSDTAVLDQDGGPVEPGSGRVGHLARRGPLPIGYHGDPERTAHTFPVIDGERWAIPGDLARVEADGRITLLGRGSASVNTGGEKVFPDEVESVLKAHPGVFDAIVVGVPDDRWGERVTAVVAGRPGLDPTDDELDGHCRAHLAAYKVPRLFARVDSIRRTPTGKPDHVWARDEASRAEG